MRPSIMAAVVAAAVLVVANGAEERRAAAQQQSAGAREPYTPGLGEIMSLTQMRHMKLWLAGAGKNWELADYELDELKEGFEDAAKYFKVVEDIQIADLIGSCITPVLPGLKAAIDARDATKFAAAFDKLTAGCNSCHQAAKHAYIVIQRPTSSPYPNQSFAPINKP
jgi:hypothetical protein